MVWYLREGQTKSGTLLVCETGLTEGKDPSVGPGLSELMWMVPRMR